MLPLSKRTGRSLLLPALVYTALTSAIVSSLGMLLVPTIAEELSVSVSSAQWMLAINLLVGAVATPIMGRLSDGPHKKRLLQVSLATILVGSVLAACAPNFTVFLIGRALQGLSYGIVPVTIALARRYLAEDKVRVGISSLSVTVSTGLGIGYPLTGILASAAGFRAAFAFAAVFLVTASIVVWRIVPNGPDERGLRTRFDTLGAVLLGTGLAALLVAVSEGSNWGWSSAWTVSCFLAAAVLLAGWALVELRIQNPLVNLRVVRNKDVLLANSTAIGLGAAMYIGLSVSSPIAQSPTSTGYGIALPLFWAGFVMLPLSVGSFGANRVVRALARRIRLTTLLPPRCRGHDGLGLPAVVRTRPAVGDPRRDAPVRRRHGHDLRRDARAHRTQRGRHRARQRRQFQPGPPHRRRRLRQYPVRRRPRRTHGRRPASDRRRHHARVRPRGVRQRDRVRRARGQPCPVAPSIRYLGEHGGPSRRRSAPLTGHRRCTEAVASLFLPSTPPPHRRFHALQFQDRTQHIDRRHVIHHKSEMHERSSRAQLSNPWLDVRSRYGIERATPRGEAELHHSHRLPREEP